MEKISGKKNILVIDDEEGIRTMLETRLYKCGYMVDTAGNGLHAMQKLRSGNHYDLIICDLKMPGMSGADLFKEIKNMKHKEVPFLLITGYPEKDKLTGALRSGIKDIMLKPLRFNNLMEKVEILIGPIELDIAKKAAA